MQPNETNEESAPVLLGLRMSLRMRVAGVTGWEASFGGITCFITHDPRNRLPFYWQINAWHSTGAASCEEVELDHAVSKIEGLLLAVARAVGGAR